MLTVGQMTLITDTTAFCRVMWGRAKSDEGALSISVHIETTRGESWQSRKVKAIAEARRLAGRFLELTDDPGEGAELLSA